LKIEAFLMSTPRTIRMIRVRRAAALSVAAVAVVLGPTACDSASAGDSSGYGAGHSQHGTEVVTVANERADEDGDIRNGRERGDRGDREDTDREGRDGDRGDRGPGPEENPAADEDAPGEEDPAALQEADDEGEGGSEAEAAAARLGVLGRDCEASDLEAHRGLQEGNLCSDTEFGEVGSEENNPSLLITEFPETVPVNEPFEITVATRNLVRDRFLGAADGGYYLESSFLNGEGLQRGHFHTACRVLPNVDEPPDQARVPEFFLATQDNQGSDEADEVVIEVPGFAEPGQIQCSSWAGDGSHRIPMMQRANQTPAFDSVRITVE
jgi:hypothetical protein